MIESKTCARCKIEKPLSAFTRASERKDGHYPQCKECRAAGRRRDKEKISARQCAYYQRNKETKKAAAARWYYENPERAASNRRRYYLENQRVTIERAQKWHDANPDKARTARSKWKAENPETVRAHGHNRRARIKGVGGTHTAKDIQALFDLQKGKCAHSWCRRSLSSGFHVDHRVPICLGGSNGSKNLQLLCQPCNSRKSAKHPIDFAQQNGMLL